MRAQYRVCARRAYDEPAATDGTRVLVNRLWPRGLAKATARIDEWLKEVAPSDGLRRWYGHDPDKFPEFRQRYAAELKEPERSLALFHLRTLAQAGTLTLLTGTKDLQYSHAALLACDLQEEPSPAADPGERGGDPACWLARVCPQCGTLSDAAPAATCATCGAAIGTA